MVSLSTDSPPVLTALAAGHVTIMAGGASADVLVYAGALPLGTTIWSNPGDGSGVSSIVPAVPSATGVADVFAFQNDGTVQALTSDGTVAWSANVSNATAIPDFQGGLVLSTYSGNIMKLDGITGQPYPAFSNGLGNGTPVVVHADGTIFTTTIVTQTQPDNSLKTTATIIGIDPIGGTPKFSVPVIVSVNVRMNGNPIIAGDGYAYVLYESPLDSCGDNCVNHHLNLLRVNSAGASDIIHIMDWQGKIHDVYGNPGGMITNADTGIVFTVEAEDYGSFIVTTTGTGVSIASAQRFPDQQSVYVPVLQAQDGSFVGTVTDNQGQTSMIAFDGSGSIRWSVPNQLPAIATATGGVVTEAAIVYDQNGITIDQLFSMPTQSWLAYQYQIGSTNLVSRYAVAVAASWWPFKRGNASGNGTGVKLDWFPALERQPHQAIYNALFDLMTRLREPTVKDKADIWVFALMGRNGDGSARTTDQFLNYLKHRPLFFDGLRSNYCFDALSGDSVAQFACGLPLIGRVLATVSDKFVTNPSSAYTWTPRSPLLTYFKPSAILTSSDGKNLGNESLLFHEALHGVTGFFDYNPLTGGGLLDRLFGTNAGGMPICSIESYLQAKVLSASPGLDATKNSCP